MLLRLDQSGARDGDDKHGLRCAGFVLERNGRGADGVFATGCEVEDCAHLLAALSGGVDEGPIAGRTGELTPCADQPRRIKGRGSGGIRRGNSGGLRRVRGRIRARIAVETNLHSRRNRQIGQKALIEALTADQAYGLPRRRFAAGNGAHREDAQRRSAVREIFALEEGGLGRSRRRLGVAETRRPLGRADDITVRPHNFKEIELRVLSERLRLVQIGRRIDRLSQFEGHRTHSLASGDAVDGRRHLGGAVLELALELADKERRLLLIALLKDEANANQDRPRHRRHGSRYGKREEQQELLPQVHGASSSETSPSNGAPSGVRRRSRTRLLAA